jgi:CheY-like chemotaxis protein
MTTAPTILLLDAEPMLRDVTAKMLERRGGRVQSVATLPEAIRHASEQLFDVVIVDVGDGSSEDAAEVLDALAAGNCLPRRIVACTSAPLAEDQASRFSSVIDKPFDFDDLVTAVFGNSGGRRRRPAHSGTFPRLRSVVRTPRRAAQGRRGHV